MSSSLSESGLSNFTNKLMADKKQLVLVVECNAALGPHWRTIYSDYLEKIIRSFCGQQTTKAASHNVELALVQFNANGSYNSSLVQRNDWISNVDYFLEGLSAMQFPCVEVCDAAIAEGLAEVLMMFPAPIVGQTQQISDSQRHCILVSASDPYPLPTPAYQRPYNHEMQSENCLFDAETLAKSFPQSLISLSIICPRQLPKLESIYNAGKRSSSATDYTIHIMKNEHYLVLISENFIKAFADLSESGITVLASNESRKRMQPDLDEPGLTYLRSNERCKKIKADEFSVESLLNFDPMIEDEPSVQPIENSDGYKKLYEEFLRATMPPPPPRMPQQVETPQSSQSQSEYIKIWEGDLTAFREDHSVMLITRLECYRKWTDPELLAADWPPAMVVHRLIPQHIMNKMKCVKAPDILVFIAKTEHPFILNMKTRKDYSVILLPSQALLLFVSDKPNQLVGLLLPCDVEILLRTSQRQPQPWPPPPPPPLSHQ